MTEEKEQKPFSCELCHKGYSSLKSLKAHKKKFHLQNDQEIIIKDNDARNDKDVEKLKNDFKRLVISNPSYDLKAPIKLNQELYLIDQMEVDELQARILDVKRQVSKKLDMKFSDGVLNVSAFVLGNLLNCVDELHKEFENDELLKESVNDVLSNELLVFIDPKIKLAGLMSMDTMKAYLKSAPRRKQEAMINKIKQERDKKLKNIVEEPPQEIIEEKKED
jgi:hypothetical protein